MFGSIHREYGAVHARSAERFYTVDVVGRTLWGWERRDENGALLACSEQLFMDYVSCFCDAQGRKST